MTIKFYSDKPYYDDFDETKNYVRILFRPGASVQARELTQMQTAIQAQIDRHGQHVFKEGSPVLGGNMSFDSEADYVKLESSFTTGTNNEITLNSDNYWEELIGTTITGQTTGVSAVVVDAVAFLDSDNPITVYVKYIDSGTDTETKTFTTGELLVSDGTNGRIVKVKDALSEPIGRGARFSIEEGVFFVNGNFVYSSPGSLILSRYDNKPSVRIAYQITESIVTSAEDITLSDNALGTPNEAAPGAHRYQILLNLITQPFDFTETRVNNFIQLMVIENGRVKEKARTEYSALADTLAQRTYEESGNYSTKPFLLNMRELYNDGTNNGLYTVAQIKSKYDITDDADAITYGRNRLAIGLEKSVAYVNGYRIELQDVKYIDLLKSRETSSTTGVSVVAPVGNYIYVDITQGLPDVKNFSTMNLVDSDDITIGSARARSLEHVSTGSTSNVYKLYLFDIKMFGTNVFSSVRKVVQSFTTNVQFIADLIGTTAADFRLYGQDTNSVVFPLPFNTVKSLKRDDTLRTKYTGISVYEDVTVGASKFSTIVNSEGTFQPYNTTDWIAVRTTNVGTTPPAGDREGDIVAISGVSITTGGDGTTSIATVNFATATSGNVTIFAPVRKAISAKTKSLDIEYTGTIETPNTTPGEYDTLGTIDVLSINYIQDEGISDGAGYLDVTDRYELDNGQRENFYDIARIKLKPGANAPAGRLLFSVRRLTHSPGDYFSVDSYTAVDYEEIPSFQSIKGNLYLRDVIDFRPSIGEDGNTFTSDNGVTVEMIKPGSLIETDVVYYLNRVDKVYVDKYGTFGIVEGVPDLSPKPPRDPQDSMILYELSVGAYTFGTSSITPKMIDNRRYTMRDIGRLEGRIKNLEYYTTLSLLEKETSDYQLPTGSFKNGFIVDSFHGHNIGNPAHPDYSCSIDKANGILRPQFDEREVRLRWYPTSSSNIRKTGPLLTLDYSEVKYIEQPYASYSEYVNPYNVFTWSGDVKLSPETDNWKDTETRPEVIIDQEGVYDSFKQLADASGVFGTVWNEWQTNWSGAVPGSTTTTNQTWYNPSFSTFVPGRGRQVFNIATTIGTLQTNSSREGLRTEVVPDTVTTNLGDRVVEVNFIPFIRSRIVSFKAERMKPNTKVYAYFDGKNITDYATQTAEFFDFNDFTNANPEYTQSYTFNGDTAWPSYIADKTDLVTDAAGNLYGFFIVPNNDQMRFRTGQRIFRLTDSVDNVASESTTFSEAVYEASGLLEAQENVVLSTRVPRIDRSSVSENKTSFQQGVTISQTRTQTGWYDPLAQTIMIDEPGGIFATSIDLYFADFDENIPVSVHLVPTLVGLPTMNIIPFTKVVKTLTAANVSDNGSVATNFLFEAPVHLQQGVEYAIVILSMSDKPKVWVSEMGGYDVTNPTYRISKQPYAGVFFKSQNASTWTPEQTKDLKFRLNRANFTTSTVGSAVFKNIDPQPRRGSLMGTDPLVTTAGSKVIKVIHPNHGLFASSKATISGVVANTGSTTVYGIAPSDINGERTVTRVERDAYWFTAGGQANATTTGRAGGTAVTSKENILMNAMHLAAQQLVIPGTDIAWSAKTTTGKSLSGTETPYVRSAFFSIIPNETMYFNRLQCVPTTENQAGGVPGLDIAGTLYSETQYLSPVIDLDRMSVYTIANLIDNPTSSVNPPQGSNYIEGFVDDTASSGASGDCKYVTKTIQIVGEANAIRVLLNVNRPTGTNIKLYYKVQAAEDTSFDDLPWVLQLPDEEIPFDDNPISYTEVEYSIDDELNSAEFTNMAFKIVLTSSNSSFVPTVKDLRAIAFNQ